MLEHLNTWPEVVLERLTVVQPLAPEVALDSQQWYKTYLLSGFEQHSSEFEPI